MRESRTNKAMNASFKSKNTATGGYIGSHIKIDNNKFRKNMNNEGKLRNEVQASIKDMVTKRKSIEEIKEYLNQEKYIQYKQYLDEWIQNWIIKLNPDVKSVITKGLNRNSQEQEMINLIKQINPELYKIYEKQIRNKIKAEIQSRELAKKKEELKKQEQEEER